MKKIFFLICIILFISCNSFSQEFTIVVIPDTQNYVNYETNHDSNEKYPINQAEYFYRQMQYIADNSEQKGGDIVFAVHVGDFVSHWGEYEIEWERSAMGMRIIDGIVPFIAVPGNHDYDACFATAGSKSKNRIAGSDIYNKYFGPKSEFFINKDWYKGSFDSGRNSYVLYKIHGNTFLFIGLELEPSDAAIDWAQHVIDENPGLPTIVVTHEYLSIYYDKKTPGQNALLEHNYRLGFDRNTPQQLWKKFISKNNQIFIVLCGHHFNGGEGEGARTDINDAGLKVYTLLQNYQGRKDLFDTLGIEGKKLNCGDGWLRLLKFNLDKGEIEVKTYSTEFKRFEKDPDSDFTIVFDWDWKARFITR